MPQTIHLFLEALANPEDDPRVQRVLALRDGGWQRRESDDGEETALFHDDGIILFLDRETRVLVHVLLTAHGLVALHEAGDDLVDELVPMRGSLHELLGAPQSPGEGPNPREMWLLGQRRWLFADFLESGIVDELTLRCIPDESPRDTRWSQPGAPTGRIGAYMAAFGQPEPSEAVQHALRLHDWDWTLDDTGATSLPLASLSHAIFSDVASVGVEFGPTDDRAVVAVTFDHAAFRTTDAIAEPVLRGPHDIHGATMAGVRVALGQPLGLLAGTPGTDRASHDLFDLDDGLALVVSYDDMRVVTRAVLQPVPPQLR